MQQVRNGSPVRPRQARHRKMGWMMGLEPNKGDQRESRGSNYQFLLLRFPAIPLDSLNLSPEYPQELR